MDKQTTLVLLLSLSIFFFSIQSLDKPSSDIMTARAGHQDQKQIDSVRDLGRWIWEFDKVACILVDYDDDEDEEEDICSNVKPFIR